MKRRVLSVIVALSLLLTLAACSEGEAETGGERESEAQANIADSEARNETKQSVAVNESLATVGTPIVANPNELRLDSEFLSEFGMTLSELEAKHGAAISGRLESESATYFFKEGSGGYSFEIWDEESTLNSQSTLSDGTARIKDVDRSGNRVEFRFFRDGRVSDLFLDMKSVIAVEEIKKISGVTVAADELGELSFSTQYIFCTLDWNGPGTGQPSHWLTVFVQTGLHEGESFVVQIKHEEERYIRPDSSLYVQRIAPGTPQQ